MSFSERWWEALRGRPVSAQPPSHAPSHAPRPAPAVTTTTADDAASVPPIGQVPVAMLEALLERSSQPLAIIDPDNGKITHANAALCAALAAPSGSLHGTLFADLLTSNDRRELATFTMAPPPTDGQPIAIGQLLLRAEQDCLLDAYLFRNVDANRTEHLIIAGQDITESVAVRDAQVNSDDRFLSLFQGSPDATLIVRASDLVVTDCNEALTRHFGHRRERVIGNSLIDVGLWPNPGQLDEHLSIARRTGEALADLRQLTLANGAGVEARVSSRYIYISAALGPATIPAAGPALSLLMVIRDVSEQRAILQALREREAQFSQVFEGNPDGITIVRMQDDTIVDANPFFCALSGYDREELIGRNVKELGLAQYEDPVSIAGQLDRFGGFRDQTIKLKSRSGVTIPTLSSATLVALNGESHLITLMKDERDLLAARAAQHESERRFRGAFQNAPMGIALVDLNFAITESNRWLSDLTGYEPEELVGAQLSRLVPADERARLTAALSALRARDGEIVRTEQRIERADNEYRWTTFHASLQPATEQSAAYYIVQLADITELKASQEQMAQLAFRDPLTGLANRRLFTDRLEQTLQRASRSGRPSALLYLDLDKFKTINDTLGHDYGDELLQAVASRLRACVRREDTVARPGGDEFTILLNDIRNADAAGQVAEHILKTLREPVTIRGQELSLTTSIGIALIPADGSEATQLLRRADQAMYQAKQQGRSRFHFYGDDMNDRAASRVQMEHALTAALDRQQLQVHYQPIVSLSDTGVAAGSQVVAYESLLRWDHPERGLLAPDAFLQLSTDSGLVQALDTWTLRTACAWLAAFTPPDSGAARASIAVNISPKLALSPSLLDIVRSVLEETGLAPSRLQLELGESVLTEDLTRSLARLKRLKNLGIGITIDRYGSHTGSLSALTRLPIDNVKFDPSLISQVNHQQRIRQALRHAVALASDLRITSIAEGIDTDAVRQSIRTLGVDLGQGRFFAADRPQSSLLQGERRLL